MNFYKKVFLTLSGAGMLAACGPTTYRQGTVIKKKEYTIFLDMDNDGLADQMFQYYNEASTNRSVYEYIMPGDTVVWKPGNAWNGPYYPRDIKTVNGMTPDEISSLIRIRKSHNGKIR